MLLILISMISGGVLGFYCQYPYPHASSNTAKQLPSSLQGVDMVVYSVFKSLSLKTEILPLLDLSPLDEMDETEYEREEECYHDDPWSYIDDYDFGDDFPECESCYPDFPTFEEWKAKRPRIDRVGTKLHSLGFSESSGDAGYIREAKEEVSSPSQSNSNRLRVTIADGRDRSLKIVGPGRNSSTSSG
jgi:hypothetical protein